MATVIITALPTSVDLKTQEEGWVFVALYFKMDHMYDYGQGIKEPHNEAELCVLMSLEGRLAWVTYWFLSPLRKSWLIPVKAIGLLNHINSKPRHLAW